MPSVIKLMKANKEIVIKAGEPLATIIPISLTSFSKDVLELHSYKTTEEEVNYSKAKSKAYEEKFKEKGFSNWYRDTTDHLGKQLGSHELKSLKLNIQDKRTNYGY